MIELDYLLFLFQHDCCLWCWSAVPTFLRCARYRLVVIILRIFPSFLTFYQLFFLFPWYRLTVILLGIFPIFWKFLLTTSISWAKVSSFYIIFDPHCLSFKSLDSITFCLNEIWIFFFIVRYNDILAGNNLLHCNNCSVSFLVLAICSMTDAEDLFFDGTNLRTSLGTSTQLQHANFLLFVQNSGIWYAGSYCVCNIICFFH